MKTWNVGLKTLFKKPSLGQNVIRYVLACYPTFGAFVVISTKACGHL